MDVLTNSTSWDGHLLADLVPDVAWGRFLELWSITRVLGLLWAVSWLAHRIWQINSIPRSQLEDKLGLDIPPVPYLSLGGVYSTSAKLHWLNASQFQSNLSFTVEVNGIEVGAFRLGDTTIEIRGLVSGQCYSIRVSVTNSTGNTSFAPIIRIQTGAEDSSTSTETNHEPAFIRTTTSRIETSENQNTAKENTMLSRILNARKMSTAASSKNEQASRVGVEESSEEEESSIPVEELVRQLENLKRQKEEIDRQIEEEDHEYRTQSADLTKERERLRQVHKDKEEASAELRRQGNQLDKLHRSAQSRRTAKEKQLQQKRTERQKFKDDIARRDEEISDMRNEVEELRQEKSRFMEEKDGFLEEKRKAIHEDQNAIKALEEDIHAKGVQIKVLEQKMEEINDNNEDPSQQQMPSKASDDSWDARYQAIQIQLAQWRQALQQANIEEQQIKEHLKYWLDRRDKNPEQFAPIPGLDNPSPSQIMPSSGRHSNSRTSTISVPGYESSQLGVETNAPPPFSTAPFFSMGNGTAVLTRDLQGGITQVDVDLLTGGAAMSPAANDLLPSNLFRDDDVSAQQSPSGWDPRIQGGNGPFARHAMSNSDASARGFNTPGSTGSRSGSMIPSPRDSLHNLHGLRSRSDTFEAGSDLQSINSTSSPLHPSMTAESNTLPQNRFANLFSSPFNRQRGKSNANEAPLLGTLKQGQSQSFPRKFEPIDLDTPENRRRKGGHGHWANPMANLLTRNSASTEDDNLITARTSSGRRSRLNVFGSGSRLDSSESSAFNDQGPSSRPSSTYSQDQIFARHSNEGHGPWWPNLDGAPNRNSPLGAHWNQKPSPWSNAQPNAASIQPESTTNLSIGSLPLDPDEYSGPLKKQVSDQAPIGTRPRSSQRPANPKLNPAAPSFKTLFGRGEGRKVSKQDKGSSKLSEKGGKEKESEKLEADDLDSTLSSSPGQPRLSRDAQSITTAGSTADSYDSFDRSTSGTPSDVVTPGPKEPKETLMQKITRKSSSSKFNVPWSKERGFFSRRAGEPSTPGEADEDNLSEGQLARSPENTGSSSQQEKAGRTSISWSNIRKKPKKTDATDRSSEAGEDEE